MIDLSALESLVKETYQLWPPGWVTFNWRGYTFDHVQRVRALAIRLAREENADPEVVEVAALLHDITKPYDGEYVTYHNGRRITDERGLWLNRIRRPDGSNTVTELYDSLRLEGLLHNESGAQVARHLLLSMGASRTFADRVAETILDHLRPDSNAPIESHCLYDADTIDANIGLPAFVRNIYIRLHFYDRRRSPDQATLNELLRRGPRAYLSLYISDDLEKWVEGKRRDFTPRLFTSSARALAQRRLTRLQAHIYHMRQELVTYPQDGTIACLDLVWHFVQNRDDPSIAREAEQLAERWRYREVRPCAQTLLQDLLCEMRGEA